MTIRISALLFSALALACVTLSPARAAEEESATAPAAPPPAFEYVQMDPITLPVFTTKGLTQQVRMIVQLEVDYDKRQGVEALKPRLLDAYLQDLYGALNRGGIMKNNFIDPVAVKQRLTAVTGRVLGTDSGVRDVLLEFLQQHPL